MASEIWEYYGSVLLSRDSPEEFVKKLGLENTLVFQHDNVPKHTAGTVKDWLKH